MQLAFIRRWILLLLSMILSAAGRDSTHQCFVRSRGNFVGVFEKGNLIWCLSYASLVNGRLQTGEVGVIKGKEGDVRGDLVFDRPYFGFVKVSGGEVGVDIVAGEDLVDLVSIPISIVQGAPSNLAGVN